ncbi:MAG: NUDIX domain-containing protein [Bacteroidales bacterium]
MSYTYRYPRPALTVDAMVFRKTRYGWQILLIKRKNEPFKNKWALPGGFVDMHETLEEAVSRELKEETGLEDIILKQYHAFSDPERDPRGRTVSVVFYGFVKGDSHVKGYDDAAEAKWHNLNQLPGLAFDHHHIIRKAIDDLNL